MSRHFYAASGDHDQFQLRGYQRRVTMRGQWASMHLLKKKAYCPIVDLRVAPAAEHRLWNVIRSRYEGSRFWTPRHLRVREWLEKAFINDHLWMVNTSLIHSAADYLDLGALLVQDEPQELKGAARAHDRGLDPDGPV